jgi:hypothetical protein
MSNTKQLIESYLKGAPTTVGRNFECGASPIQYVFEVFPTYEIAVKFFNDRF